MIMRTTLDIDTPVLRDLKKLQKKEKKTLGQLVSELLAEALDRRQKGRPAPPKFEWVSKAMRELVDISDKDALHAVLDRRDPRE